MKVLKHFLIFLILLCHADDLCAQIENKDLLHELSLSKSDTQKLQILNQLIENIDQDSLWLPYNDTMGQIAHALLQNNNLVVKQLAQKYYGTYYNNLGYAAENNGNTPEALDYYYRALKLHETANDLNGVSIVLNNIGYIKNGQNDKQNALLDFKRSLQIQIKLNDSSGIALSLLNIGSIYDDLAKADSAVFYYQQSLKVSQSISEVQKSGMALSNLGSYYDKHNQLDSAQFYYTKALEIQQQINDIEGLTASHINFGNIYLRQKNYPLAIQYFEQAMHLANKSGYIKLKRGAALWLSKVYAQSGNYKDAYKMHVLHKQLADSISNAETRKEMVKKQMQYEYEKKAAIIKTEHDKQTLIEKNETEKQRQIKLIVIVASLILLILMVFGFYNFYSRKKETYRKTVEQVNNKALRAQMNPHFIFNSLNSIQDFINNNDLPNANTYIVKFAKLIRLILENSQHQEVLLADDLKALELYMQLESLRLPFGFDYEIKIDGSIDADNTLLPPLILQPFVENSIWHGLQHKKTRGRILVAIHHVNQELQCTVEDNGVGRQHFETNNTVQTKIKRKSMGMQITGERIRLYNSMKKAHAYFNITDITDINNKNAGVRVQLYLPFEEAL
jgi:tetratricopeptide (TPR) repeat protein